MGEVEEVDGVWEVATALPSVLFSRHDVTDVVDRQPLRLFLVPHRQ
jgi:hypothetical protein